MKKLTKHILPLWYLWVPLILCLCELFFVPYHAGFRAFYKVALRDQFWLVVGQGLGVLVRAWCGYVMVAGLVDFILQFLLSPPKRIAVFLVGYASVLGWVTYEKPALGLLLEVETLVFVALGVALLLFLKRKKASWARQKVFLSVGLSWVCWLVLFMTQIQPWEQATLYYGPVKLTSSAKRPSFVWVGLDGVPGDLFNEGKSLSQSENHKSVVFRNAYSLSNSTYTSWYSLLSGKMPSESKVQFLFPRDRLPDKALDRLLPNQLKKAGYRSVFMTDCASTSSMDAAFGFDRLYQMDIGVLGCGRALMASAHPLTYLLGMVEKENRLFAELDSFCSALFRPENFFAQVERELKQLNRSGQPFLLAVHSCFTHQDVFPHLSKEALDWKERFSREALRDKKRWLPKLINGAKKRVEHLIQTNRENKQQPWYFVFSDHGVKLGPLASADHASGEPISRYQYNVPLVVIPPADARLAIQMNKDTAVGLSSLYGTVRKLAGIVKVEKRSLLGKQLGSSIFMTSAFGGKSKEILQGASLDDEGILHFTQETEAQLSLRQSRAVLSWPYRLVVSPQGKVRLFHELKDPHNLEDISESHPNIVWELQQKLDSHPKPIPDIS